MVVATVIDFYHVSINWKITIYQSSLDRRELHDGRGDVPANLYADQRPFRKLIYYQIGYLFIVSRIKRVDQRRVQLSAKCNI